MSSVNASRRYRFERHLGRGDGGVALPGDGVALAGEAEDAGVGGEELPRQSEIARGEDVEGETQARGHALVEIADLRQPLR